MCHVRNATLLLALLACLSAPAIGQAADGLKQTFADSLTAIPPGTQTISGAFYVPAYSSVAMTPGRIRADFSVTLSVHNASDTRPLILKRISYFDTAGAQVDAYLQEPVALKPYATIEIFIATKDVRGGTGANFVVEWGATGEIAEPVVEALMVGSLGSGHYAFISQGRPIRLVGK
jgi:hypothetical protein